MSYRAKCRCGWQGAVRVNPNDCDAGMQKHLERCPELADIVPVGQDILTVSHPRAIIRGMDENKGAAMDIDTLTRMRSTTADPAAHEALTEATWFWQERAEDIADDPADIPAMVADHLADVAEFLRGITDDDDLAVGDDDDPALVSAKHLADATPRGRWYSIATALDDLAVELAG